MHICYKLFGWKPWSILSNYDIDRGCERCPKCGGTSFRDLILDTVSNNVSEVDTYCISCGEYVNFWAYGYYDPSFAYCDRSFEMWLIRLNGRGK